MPVKIFALPRRLGFTFRVMLFCLFAGLHRSHTTDLHRMKGCSMSQRKTHWILGRSSISPFIIGKNSILLHRIWQKFWLSECISRCNVIFLYILLSLTSSSSSSSCRFTVLGALKFWLHVMEKQSIDFVNTIKVFNKNTKSNIQPVRACTVNTWSSVFSGIQIEEGTKGNWGSDWQSVVCCGKVVRWGFWQSFF